MVFLLLNLLWHRFGSPATVFMLQFDRLIPQQYLIGPIARQFDNFPSSSDREISIYNKPDSMDIGKVYPISEKPGFLKKPGFWATEKERSAIANFIIINKAFCQE